MDPHVNTTTRRRLLAKTARRTALVGITINAILALGKGLAGWIGHSQALIADGVESLSDVFTSAGVAIGASVAAAPPSREHPYGKGRAETIAAACVALALFGASIWVAIMSIHEIRTPHQAPKPFTLVVLVAVIIIKEVFFRRIRTVNTSIESAALESEAWHHRADAITSAFAFVGISTALLLGPGYEAADDWAALLAAAVIAFNAWHLLAPALDELLDAQAHTDLEAKLREIAASVDGVHGTHKCFIRKVGFDHFVDLDILVDGSMSVKEGHDLAHRVEQAIRIAVPSVIRVLVHVEPEDEYGRHPLFQ